MAELFREVLRDPPHMNIGKNGITENVVTHILELLKIKKIIKIKILKETAHLLGVDTVITQLQQQCRVVILDVRGFTIIIAKKNIPGIRSSKKYNPTSELNLISSQQTSLESSTIEDADVSSEYLTSSPKTISNLSPEEPTRTKHLEHPPLGAPLKLNPEYIDYDNIELLTELDHLEDSVQTVRESTRKTSHPRSSAIHEKKQSKKTTRKSQSNSKTRRE